MNKKPTLEYVMRKVTIDVTQKDLFSADEKQRRMIRKGSVRGIVQALKTGQHFNSPFVINHVNGVRKLIDGNHRWEAILELLEYDPEFSMDIWFAEYKDLSHEEERDVFSLWNIGTKQSSDDFLKIYWDTIPKGKEILDRIPASIYNSKTKIKAKNIVGNHIAAKKGKRFAGGYSGNSLKAVRDFKDITSDDISIMSAYMKDMEQIFGAFNSTNIFWKGTPQSAFYRIWYDNRDIPPTKMIRAFKKTFLGVNQFIFETAGKSGGIEASKAFYNLAMQQLVDVRGISGYVFKYGAIN